jgi:hypothetical protein
LNALNLTNVSKVINISNAIIISTTESKTAQVQSKIFLMRKKIIKSELRIITLPFHIKYATQTDKIIIIMKT